MLCNYCGEKHNPKFCQLRHQVPFDAFGILHFSIRKRESKSICNICGGELKVGELEARQSLVTKGKFYKMNRAHLSCFIGVLMSSYEQYKDFEAMRANTYKETNRTRARERYTRRIGNGGT